MDCIRLLLADDHKLVRAGIRSLLERLSGVEVIAEAGDGLEALRLVEETRPDLVLMDIGMPGQNGLEATRYLSKEFPSVKVIILSIHSDEEHVYQALRAGAAGYLLKGAATAELELAIRAVAQGETYLSPPVSRPVIMDYVQRTHARRPGQLDRLSPRQTQVLQLIAEGRNTKQIALALDISVKTVETHRAALMTRLGVNDIAGLVRYALKTGVVNLQ
ncbi:MAG TPA: response regulator transcription factor [Pyrinomonadaceae bacterium]|nr:response regulator transcription factor [Pyrinomonadaceae bacterium]